MSRQDDDSVSGATGQLRLKLCGQPMSHVEEQLVKVFTAMGSSPTLVLSGLRDKRLLQNQAMTAKQLSLQDWAQVLSLAVHLGFGEIAYRRGGRAEADVAEVGAAVSRPSKGKATKTRAAASSDAAAEHEDGDAVGGDDTGDTVGKRGQDGRKQMVFDKKAFDSFSAEAKRAMNDLKITQQVFVF